MANFTRNDWIKFNSATHYHVCEKSFAKDDTGKRSLSPNNIETPRIQIAI